MTPWPAVSILMALAAAPAAPARPAIPAKPAASACLNLTASRVVTLTGRLAMRTFPGSPNFESVAEGDEPETVFILTLPRAMCADDQEFIGPDQRFRTVHVFAEDDAFNDRLRGFVGKTVTVRGEGFGAHTGHHHAPLVLAATTVAPAALRPARK